MAIVGRNAPRSVGGIGYSDVREKVSELLQRYRSEDSRRAGRNASILSSTIIAVHILKLKLSDVSVFGLKVPPQGLPVAKIILAALLVYFVLTFALYLYRDRQIQRDRKRLAMDQVEVARARYEWIEDEERKHGQGVNHLKGEKGALANLLKEADAHASQTRRARVSDFVALCQEVTVPVILGMGGFAALAFGS